MPNDWEEELRKLSGLTDGDIAIQADPTAGKIRMALTQAGRITGLFFVSPTPIVLSRTTIVGLIGTDIPPLVALAGQSRADQPDVGPTVCACFNVGRNTLLSAAANGARSVAALGDVTFAGTNCGSCKPELRTLLARAQLPMAAE